jgi:glycosyltransferase involved in cell wall biosynthesis
MPINRGQGAALSAGLEYLQEKQNPDIIVTFDADGQHQPEDIEKLVTPLLEDKADIVLGSRFLGTDSQVPLARKAVLKAGIVFTNLVSGVKLSDTHNGLRALGRKAIHSIRISQRGMTHASEIIDEIARHKLKYEEVPVEIIYSDYSKAKGQRTSGFLKLGLKFIINKLSK